MAIEKIDKIKKIGKKLSSQAPVREPEKDVFESLMRQRKVQTERTENEQSNLAKKTENNLFDQVRELNQRVDYATRSSPGELAAQADDAIAQIDILKNKLETPDLEIKNSVQTILKQKLNHIDENLKVALDRAGLEYKPPEKPTSLAKPVERFLGLLTHSQSQLETLSQDVRSLSMMDRELSPANMLLIQVKVSYIQQEIELFTSMLNKALESTKTIMNVQV